MYVSELYKSGWWSAGLYLLRTESDDMYPDMSIGFKGLPHNLAEQVLPTMVQALADAVGVPVRIEIAQNNAHTMHNLTVSPSADK